MKSLSTYKFKDFLEIVKIDAADFILDGLVEGVDSAISHAIMSTLNAYPNLLYIIWKNDDGDLRSYWYDHYSLPGDAAPGDDWDMHEMSLREGLIDAVFENIDFQEILEMTTPDGEVLFIFTITEDSINVESAFTHDHDFVHPSH